MSLFYQELKDRIKNKLAKIEWSDDLDEMMKIAVQIDNCLWKKQQKKKKKNSWRKQHDHNKNQKKDHEQSMNWKYINNWKTEISKQECQKKELCFYCDKKKYQIKKCRSLQNQTQKSVKIWVRIITTTEKCKQEWCQKMICQQHHSK